MQYAQSRRCLTPLRPADIWHSGICCPCCTLCLLKAGWPDSYESIAHDARLLCCQGKLASAPWRFVRLAGNEDSDMWPIWFDVKGKGELGLELWIGYHHSQSDWPGARYLSTELPDWAATAVMLVYQSSWRF